VLLADFQAKITDAEKNYLDVGEGGDADERLERVIYGRFLEPEARKAFFDCYKDIEALWEILSFAGVARPHSNLQAARPIVRRRPERLRQQRSDMRQTSPTKPAAWSRRTPRRRGWAA
jgi:hypothetical protein